MSDGSSGITSKSWLERIIESIKGVLVGIVLFLIAFPLLFWNEGRAIKTYRDLKDGESKVVEVSPEKVDSANQDKLVHMTGLATTTETLSDPAFGIAVNGLRLNRVAEIYQWKEKEEKKTRKKLGGGEETVPEYTYEKVWVDRPIDSSKFKKPEDHANKGILDFPSTTWTAAKVTLGAFTLPGQLVSRLQTSEPVSPDLAKANEAVKKDFKVSGDWYYRGADPKEAAIGDVRVKFAVVKPMTVSLYAQQTTDSFRAYQGVEGTPIERIEEGAKSAKEMFANAQAENATLTWVLRGLGLFLMWMGITLIFKPLVVIADVVPFFGNMLQMGIGVFAFLFALPFALITIAIGWIAYRPVLGISLLAGAAAVLALMFFLGRKRKATA